MKSIKVENWIDFESEIRYILQRIDEKTNNLNDKISEIFEEIHKENDAKINLFKKYFDKRNVNDNVQKDSLRAFRKIVYIDLERIIRALELYLGKYVDEIEINRIIGADSTSVIVYCYDKGVEGELIASTIKLIGEEPLLKKVNNVPPKLDYIIQRNQ